LIFKKISKKLKNKNAKQYFHHIVRQELPLYQKTIKKLGNIFEQLQETSPISVQKNVIGKI
jgi:hypothetical protein